MEQHCHLVVPVRTAARGSWISNAWTMTVSLKIWNVNLSGSVFSKVVRKLPYIGYSLPWRANSRTEQMGHPFFSDALD